MNYNQCHKLAEAIERYLKVRNVDGDNDYEIHNLAGGIQCAFLHQSPPVESTKFDIPVNIRFKD